MTVKGEQLLSLGLEIMQGEEMQERGDKTLCYYFMFFFFFLIIWPQAQKKKIGKVMLYCSALARADLVNE